MAKARKPAANSPTPAPTPTPEPAADDVAARAPLSAGRMQLDAYDDEPDPAPAAEPVAEVEPQPDPPADPPRGRGKFHSPAVVELAKEFGMDDGEIESLSPAELVREVKREQRQLLARRTEPAPAAQPLAQDPTFNLDWGKGDDGTPLGAADLGPVGHILGQLRDEVAGLRREVADLRKFKGRSEAREAQTTNDQFDEFFNEHPDIFGEGSREDMAKGSDELERRLALYESAKRCYRGNVRRACERAFVKLYPTARPAKAAPADAGAEQDDDAVQRWERAAALARPTGRAEPEDPPGPRRAAKKLQRLMQENGSTEFDPAQYKGHFLPSG